jgi:hypothetical protein
MKLDVLPIMSSENIFKQSGWPAPVAMPQVQDLSSYHFEGDLK